MALFYINKIRGLRLTYGLTQTEVAARLGISTRKYLRIENGYIALSLTDLVAICKLYRVSSDFILDISEDAIETDVKKDR